MQFQSQFFNDRNPGDVELYVSNCELLARLDPAAEPARYQAVWLANTLDPSTRSLLRWLRETVGVYAVSDHLKIYRAVLWEKGEKIDKDFCGHIAYYI